MSEDDRIKWDARYAALQTPQRVVVDPWYAGLLETRPPGRALDVACGLGHQAIWLAERGWDVTAVDISPIGLEHARRLSSYAGAAVNWQLGDLDDYVPAAETYDLISVFRFLDRVALPLRLVNALRPGGWLVYETFCASSAAASHVCNPAYVLKPDELRLLYPQLSVKWDKIVEFDGNTLARFVGERTLMATDT